jgi:hypothetical protein
MIKYNTIAKERNDSMNLYMISLGGKVSGANIEVHDVQFAAAEQIDDTIELVKANWYGLEEKLHMDSYKHIKGADGYEINLTKEKSCGIQKLFFAHLGGYCKETTQEIHKVTLIVAKTAKEAKQRASQDTAIFEEEGHVDRLVDVEECLLQKEGETYYIELKESKEDFQLNPDWYGYKRLDLT